jgi:hypothetical protein
MALFHAQPQDHLALARHLTAEVKVEEFVAGKGVTVKWSASAGTITGSTCCRMRASPRTPAGFGWLPRRFPKHRERLCRESVILTGSIRTNG